MAYLKRLCIPIGDLLNGWHLAQAIRQGLELLDAMSQTDGQLLGQEHRGAKEGAWAGGSVSMPRLCAEDIE